MKPHTITKAELEIIRRVAGCGLSAAREAAQHCPGDPLLAAGWEWARNLAVNVRGEREAWNRQKAAEFRSRNLERQLHVYVSAGVDGDSGPGAPEGLYHTKVANDLDDSTAAKQVIAAVFAGHAQSGIIARDVVVHDPSIGYDLEVPAHEAMGASVDSSGAASSGPQRAIEWGAKSRTLRW